MSLYRFYCPIQVRYADIDPQWHVNNARFMTFLEQARTTYLIERGLFDGRSFFDIGVILADLHISYLAPISLGQPIRVGMRITRLGVKSIDIDYQIEDSTTGAVMACATTVVVAYDYHAGASRPVPDLWRERISVFESIEPGPTPAGTSLQNPR